MEEAALEVDNTLLAAGESACPRDGAQFLANVVLERRRCQRVVVASTLPSTISPRYKQTVFADSGLPSRIPSRFQPTLEWQKCQVADFARARIHIAKLHQQKEQRKPPAAAIPPLILPPVDQQQSAQLWKSFLLKHEPKLSIIFGINQRMIEFILEVLNNSLRETTPGDGMASSHGQWMFALLAILEVPLHPDMHNILRNLARSCNEIRSRLSPDDSQVVRKCAPLNLFICLISRFFRQVDLADE